jgi:hypothetical protein
MSQTEIRLKLFPHCLALGWEQRVPNLLMAVAPYPKPSKRPSLSRVQRQHPLQQPGLLLRTLTFATNDPYVYSSPLPTRRSSLHCKHTDLYIGTGTPSKRNAASSSSINSAASLDLTPFCLRILQPLLDFWQRKLQEAEVTYFPWQHEHASEYPGASSEL